MKRSGRGPDCSKLIFVVLAGSLVTALFIFLTLQVFVVSSHQNFFTSRDDGGLLLAGDEESIAKGRLEELSTALLKVTEQVEKLKGMLLTLQSQTKVSQRPQGAQHNLICRSCALVVENTSEVVYEWFLCVVGTNSTLATSSMADCVIKNLRLPLL